MTRSHVAAIAALLLAGACVDSSRTTAPPVAPPLFAIVGGTETRLTTDLADQLDPAISGDLVTYADYRGADANIWYYDFATGREAPVTTAAGDQVLSDVSGGSIAYDDYSLGDVLVFDVALGTTKNVTGNEGGGRPASDPAIGGTFVAWLSGGDIFAIDLATNEQRRVSRGAVNGWPDVAGRTVVWQSCGGGSCDIRSYDWDAGTETAVTSTADRDERGPKTDGFRIVYSAGPATGGEADIYLYDIATGTERRLDLASRQTNPHLSGDFVSFENLDAGTGRYHVQIWDLSTGTVYPVGSPTSSSQFLNDIDGTRVVYTDDRNGQLDIYVYSFTVVPDATVQTIRDAVADFEQSGAITNHGIAKSLLAFLSQVEAALAAGDTAAAKARLEHFIRFVQSQTPKHITAAAAEELISMAQALLATLGA